MPDLVRKWKEQNPFFAALDEEAEKERKRRQEEQQRQEARRRYQEEQQRQEEERRREESATVTPDWRERDAERGLTPPVPSGGNGHTADLEAEFQRRNGRGNRLTPFQEYMRATVASMPEQEETRSTDELRRDMNRQNRLARATNRMAADMGNQLLRDQSGIYDPVRSTNLGVMARTMATQQEKADRATELYRTESTRRRWQEEQEKYASLLSNPDFAAKSGADETIGRNLTAASPAERLYRTITKRSDDKSNAKDRQAAEFVTDEEASIFYYLWNTQGARAAKAYYDDYVHNRASERRAVEAQRQAYEFGRNDMLGSSAESVVGNFASGVGLLDMAWQNLARSIGITDPNKPLNYYSAAQLPSLVSDSIRSGVADQLAEYFPKLSIGKAENATNVISFLYQTGMSMADSGVSILLNMVGIPEAATLANMGAIAGTRAIRDARERGATDGQALAFGISSAIMEGLFEKISLDKILEPSTATKFWPRVKNAIDQMFTEGSEEVMTTLANTAFDQLIMGDKSELFTRQRRLMEQGVSEKEALRAAMLQWGTEVLGDLLGGMISGLGMGGTKEIATGLRYAARDAQTAREMTDVQNREAAQAREQALRTAYEQAQNRETAEPVQPRQQTAREQDPLQFALTKVQNGETLTKNDARAILEDAQAVQTLRDAGVLTENVRNDSEGRTQILQAVETLAEQNRVETVQATEELSQAPAENVQKVTEQAEEAAPAQERPAPPVPSGMQQNTETGTAAEPAQPGPPLPSRVTQEQESRAETPAAQERAQGASEGLRLPSRAEAAESKPTPRAPLTIGSRNVTLNENRQEANNGRKTEAADAERFRAEARRNAAGRQADGGGQWSTGVARLLDDVRNYRTVRDLRGRADQAASLQNQADARNLRYVSGKELGVEGASDAATARILDNDMLGREWEQTVKEYAAKGVTLRAMTGQIETTDLRANGLPVTVRAWVSGDGRNIIVQADHPTLSWQQLLAHEELHRRIKGDDAYRRSVQDALLADEKLKPYLSRILDRYTEAYRTVKPGITDAEIVEELLADYRAGFDMLDPLGLRTPEAAKMAKRAAGDIRAAEKKGTKGEAAESEGAGSYSIEYIVGESGTEYGYGVNLDSTNLENMTEEQRANAVAQRLSELGGQSFIAYDPDGTAVEISIAPKNSRFKNKKGKSIPVNRNLLKKYDSIPHKQEAVYLADELIQASAYKGEDKAHNPHDWLDNNGANPWGERTAYLLAKDNSVWKALLHIANTADGEKILYDVVPIEMVEQRGKSRTSTTSLNNTTPATKVNTQNGGRASTEIDTDYLAAVNSGDMETAQRMVDEAAKKAGYTVRKYHQTDVPNIHVFDIGIGAHGGTDSETPYGIFTKNTRRDIGLGDIQMSLYLKPGKTFVIKDRSELRSRMPEAYNLLATKLEAIDEKYDALAQEAEDALFDAQDAYEAKHPEAEVTLEDIANNRTYDDLACQRANENWKAVMAEWNAEADKIRVQAKEVLSKYLRDSGYDSMEIKLDKGTNGRSTDTFIVFSPEQVKSADPVTYDDDGNIIPLSQRFNTKNEDIRFSIEIDPEVAAQFSPEAIAEREARRTGETGGKKKVSKVRSNTYEVSGLFNEAEAAMEEANKENYTYDITREKDSMNHARQRLAADFDGEVTNLGSKNDQWSGEDLDTAMGILHRYCAEGRATGDYGDFWRWSKVIQEKGTKGGQFIQAFAKYTRTGTGAAMKGAKDIHDRFALNPAQQKQVDAAKKKLLDGIDGDMSGAAQDAMKQAKGQKEPGKKQAKGQKEPTKKTDDRKYTEKDRKKLEAETQRRKDAERLVREIARIFNQKQQQAHGEPVENWLNLTGEELARKIAGRFSEPKQRTKTTMQTILSDLVGFAEEHALPDRKKAEGTKRTAIDTITDYLANRDAYGTAWAAAQSYLRAAYTDDPEKLDALNGFLTATIAYNAEGTDRTMLDAILQSADVLGISERRILELISAGATESTIDRIGDELVSQVKERMGADWQDSYEQQLKDAVRRHITGIALQESAEDQRLRLGKMTTDAARQLDLNLQKLLTESRGDKNKATQSVAGYLIRELDIPSSDAAIAAQRISEAFMDELASRADRRLQQMFAEKKPKTQEQRDRLLDLIRLDGLTNSNVEDAVVDALGIGGMSRERQRELVGAMAQFGETLDSMEADDLDGLKDLIRAQAAVRNTPLSRQAEKALAGETDAQYLREFALAQLDAIAGDFAEMSPGAKISTFQTISHLLNARTALRNLTSNQVFDLVDSAANNLATIPDMVLGAFTGKRTVGANKSWLSEMKRAGAKQGAARNALEVRLDVSPDDRQKSKYGTAGRRTNSMANSNAFGRILSHLEEIMGYELNTTDEFHKGSVRGETLESLAQFVERGDITQEQANAWAEEEALYRSFQDDTLVGNIMGELKTLLNVIGFGDSGKKNSRGRTIHDFGLGDLVVKYTQVPGALIHRGIEYSPLGYAKMLYDLAIAKDSLVRTQKRGEDVANAQRKLALDIGRATTGSGLITLFAVLAKAGLLRRDDDDKDKNAKAMHAAQGLSGTQLNLTALKRWIEGGDLSLTDGDVLADIGFLEPLDSLMTIATLLAKEEELSATDIGVRSLDGVWKAIQNTSAMQTLSNIIQTVQYHDDENDLPLYFQIPIEIAADSVSGFIPSPVRQLAQATDTTYRDQYRSQALNDQIRDKAMNSIPGLRQKLAPKITPLGEDKQYQKPLLNYLNATLNPGNINVYKSSKVVDELNRVYGETDDEKIWPERNAPYSFTANDEKYTLTPDERTQYQRTRGKTTAQAMDAVMGTEWYKAMNPTDQAEVLNWIGNFANFVAKKEMMEGRGLEYGSDAYNKYLSAWMDGTPIEDVVADKHGKLVKAAEETAAANSIIAEAKIPEASKAEAETMSDEARRYYAGFLKGGVSDATARKLATELEGSSASGHEQWRKVYDSAGSEGEKAVASLMTDDMKRNWNLAKDAGVSMDDYIKVRENYLDLNENGKKSQDEWNATLDSFTFSTNSTKDKSIKGTLWQILTGSGSTKNNPYDKEAGQKVIDAKGGGGKSGGDKARVQLPTQRQPWEMPTRSKPSSGLRLPTTNVAPRQSSGLRLK